MDHERIRIEDFIVNIKKSYKSIIKFGYTPEQFFGIAREKNKKIEEAPDGGHLVLAPKERILIENTCKENLVQHLPLEILALLIGNMDFF